jgi:hypothetical protein
MHVDANVNTSFINRLCKEYKSVFEDGSGKLVVHCRKVHKYLGTTLDVTTPGQVKVSMFAYIDEILSAYKKAAPKELGTKTSATPKDVFTVNKNYEKAGKVPV